MVDSSSGVNYEQLEHAKSLEIQQDIKRKLQAHTSDIGKTDSLRHTVLSLVVGENYARAKDELRAYIEYKKDYPSFQERAARFVDHACDLIQAIQTKRNFPGLGSLALSKQQEIHEKVLQHFDELKGQIKNIEKYERDAKLSDIRSTAWVLVALSNCLLVAVIVLFSHELNHGLMYSFGVVFDALIDGISRWVEALF